MRTESANMLSQLLEIDRATMLRALRNVPPDNAKNPDRPTWKVSTAMNALIAHRASTGRADSRRQYDGRGDFNSNWQDPLLVQLFAQQDEADAAMRKLPTLEGRRKAAIGMISLIMQVDKATRERGKINGGDHDAVDLRADSIYMLTLRGFEAPCAWSHAETWEAMNNG
jgi:hypothetical protein